MFQLTHLIGFGVGAAGVTATGALIDRTAGTIATNFNTSTANAFDGTTSQDNANSASYNTTAANRYLGKDYSATSGRVISKGIYYPSNASGFAGGGIANLEMQLRASNSAPSAGTEGTLLGTTGTIADTTSMQTINVDPSAYAVWNYVWFYVARVGGVDDQWFCAEAQFYE